MKFHDGLKIFVSLNIACCPVAVRAEEATPSAAVLASQKEDANFIQKKLQSLLSDRYDILSTDRKPVSAASIAGRDGAFLMVPKGQGDAGVALSFKTEIKNGSVSVVVGGYSGSQLVDGRVIKIDDSKNPDEMALAMRSTLQSLAKSLQTKGFAMNFAKSPVRAVASSRQEQMLETALWIGGVMTVASAIVFLVGVASNESRNMDLMIRQSQKTFMMGFLMVNIGLIMGYLHKED